MSESKIEVSAQLTPNPNTLKFMVNKTLIEKGSVDFPVREKAKGSPLPEALFDISGVTGVFVGKDFVSVSKPQDVNWPALIEPITATIKKLLETDSKWIADTIEPVVSHDSEVVQKIKQILDEEIRPAVAMDGGDITFHGYENGIVTLYLQGACSSCPASTMTLKMGVENRLKEEIPEIKEVVQI